MPTVFPGTGQAEANAQAARLDERNCLDVQDDQYVAKHGRQPSHTNTRYTVQDGDTVERIAKRIYGDQWRAGVAILIHDNNLTLNKWSNPIIRERQMLDAWDTGIYSDDGLQRLARAGGAAIATGFFLFRY